MTKKKAVKCRPGHINSVLSVMFSPDEKYVCSTSLDGTLKIYKFDAQLDPQLFYTFQICNPKEIAS
jgi:WD40 repeat protein